MEQLDRNLECNYSLRVMCRSRDLLSQYSSIKVPESATCPPFKMSHKRKVPYVGLNFGVFESLKDWLVKTTTFGLVEDSELSVTTRLACGAAAGTVGQTVAYLLMSYLDGRRWWDGVMLLLLSLVMEGARPHLNILVFLPTFRKSVRYEGFGALYKGLVPNSVMVSLFEFFAKHVLRNVGIRILDVKSTINMFVTNA